MDDLVATISKEIESQGAKVDKVDNLGRKDFAYAPRKIEGAHYVNYTITGEPECIANIREKLSLNDSVYLNQFNRVA
ncbi:MAG: 30S ribosomal protein S6 [Luteolibacter sp.]